MTFEEAITFLKQGYRIKRSSWNNTENKIKHIQIFKPYKNPIWNNYPAQFLVTVKDDNSTWGLAKFELPIEDILADDWEKYYPEDDEEKENKDINETNKAQKDEIIKDTKKIKPKIVTEQVCYGWWIVGFNSGIFNVWCSACGRESNNNSITNYCPNCGTKMFGIEGEAGEKIIFKDLYKKTERRFIGEETDWDKE